MIQICKMTSKHIDDVCEIENECFSLPWSKTSFQNEINKNKHALYFVAIKKCQVVGYVGMWHIVNEGHMTNIAVKKQFRNQGIATKLINHLFEIGKSYNMIGITLEVRVSNLSAKKLYEKLGFNLEGIRKEYYDDNREDAFIMWKYL